MVTGDGVAMDIAISMDNSTKFALEAVPHQQLSSANTVSVCAPLLSHARVPPLPAKKEGEGHKVAQSRAVGRELISYLRNLSVCLPASLSALDCT